MAETLLDIHEYPSNGPNESQRWILAAMLFAVRDGSPVVRFVRQGESWRLEYEPRWGRDEMIPFPGRVPVPRAVGRLAGLRATIKSTLCGWAAVRLRVDGIPIEVRVPRLSAWFGVAVFGRTELRLRYGLVASEAAAGVIARWAARQEGSRDAESTAAPGGDKVT